MLKIVNSLDRLIKKSTRIPKPIKALRRGIFHLMEPLFCKLYYRFYSKQIAAVDDNTQLFFIGRNDFGTHLMLLHYVRIWLEKRGPCTLIILTDAFTQVAELAKYICPTAKLIYPHSFKTTWPMLIFGSHMVRWYTFAKVYPWLAIDRPEALRLDALSGLGIGAYSPHLDPVLQKKYPYASAAFVNAYKRHMCWLDRKMDAFSDYYSLVLSTDTTLTMSPLSEKSMKEPYVVLNVNAKNYGNVQANTRSIKHVERYDVLIDYLIAKGYFVILHGRQEQPFFAPRKGFFDYSKSNQTSLKNDLALYANASFCVLNKTGPFMFASLCDIPVLGLNYTELCGFDPIRKMRFFPKYMRSKESGKVFDWKSALWSPAFFNLGDKQYEAISYEELSEEDLCLAVDEFIPLVERNVWSCFTENQQAYRNQLCPLHGDLYQAAAVPCEVYLRKR